MLTIKTIFINTRGVHGSKLHWKSIPYESINSNKIFEKDKELTCKNSGYFE